MGVRRFLAVALGWTLFTLAIFVIVDGDVHFNAVWGMGLVLLGGWAALLLAAKGRL